MNEIIQGCWLVDVVEMFVTVKNHLAIGVEARGHREDRIDMLAANIISQAATLILKDDVNAAIVLDEMSEFVTELFFVTVLASRQIERKDLLAGHQIDRGPSELERQCSCCFSRLKSAKNESQIVGRLDDSDDCVNCG